jgi:phosphatidylglycerophosphatase A
MVPHISTFIATFAYTGFFPLAPATFATFVFLLVYALVPGGEVLAHPLVVLITLVVSVPVSTLAEKRHGHDAGCIVIDEVVGIQLALVLAEPTTIGIVAAFFLFRFFDIVKPAPANRSQRLPRGYGIVADDVIAGVYTRIVLIIAGWFLPGIGRFV